MDGSALAALKRWRLYERDRKPGSVWGDHLSRLRVTTKLKRLRRTQRAADMSPLHLAPGGVYSAGLLPGPRVSSYLAFPSLLRAESPSGLFLLHFPWSRLHRPLAGTLALRCPDFPHAAKGTRSPVHLVRQAFYNEKRDFVNHGNGNPCPAGDPEHPSRPPQAAGGQHGHHDAEAYRPGLHVH